jgi:hypothetical protein
MCPEEPSVGYAVNRTRVDGFSQWELFSTTRVAAIMKRGEEVMKAQRIIVIALLLGLLGVYASTARAADPPYVSLGTNGETADKPQSKLWYHDGTWWAILPAVTQGGADDGLWIYKLDNGTLVKQGTQIDTYHRSQADVLVDGTKLYVVLYRVSTTPRGYFLEYSYSAGTYSKDVGPVDLGFGTSGESATIAKDGNGSLWVAYDTGTNIKVVWSDPTDHTSTGWTTTNGGVTVNTAALEDSDDLAAIVAFDDKIGVLWSFHYADDDPDTLSQAPSFSVLSRWIKTQQCLITQQPAGQMKRRFRRGSGCPTIISTLPSPITTTFWWPPNLVTGTIISISLSAGTRSAMV